MPKNKKPRKRMVRHAHNFGGRHLIQSDGNVSMKLQVSNACPSCMIEYLTTIIGEIAEYHDLLPDESAVENGTPLN